MNSPAVICLLVLATPNQMIPRRLPDVDGKVLQILEDEKLLLIEGITPLTRGTRVAVTENTRVWQLSGTEWIRAGFEDVRVGMRVAAYFIDSRAMLTDPIQAVAEHLVIVPGLFAGLGPPLQPLHEKPMRVAGKVLERQLIHRVEPLCPQKARNHGVQGIVLLQVLIDKEGNVEEVKVIRGHPLLVGAAVDAVMQWKYRPITFEGKPVRVIGTVVVGFRTPE